MSSAYKNIEPSNISITPYNSNKSFSINKDNISGSGVTLYIGEYLPFNQLNFFDPVNDDKTSNNEYKRLVFESIKHLYYKDFKDIGYLTNSSSYEFYPQNTLYSGSYTTTFREINLISGSSYQGINNIYNSNVVYDNIYLYDDSSSFYENKGSLINVISIDKKLYGNNIKPKSFSIILDSYYIKDDGEGNLFDYFNESNYEYCITNNIPGDIYIGNIIYSHGMVIITNSDYVCILDSPPTAINDYYSYNNMNFTSSFDITSNDYSDCNGIDYSTLELIPLVSESFPDCFLNGGLLNITNNQTAYIPGNYNIGYTIKSNNGLLSNLGNVNLIIDSYPLSLINFTSSQICPDDIDYIDIDFGIYGGVPVYSYSWDGISYNTLSGFTNVNFSSSILSTTSSIYIKDYIGNILFRTFNNYYEDIEYTITTTKSPSCGTSGTLNITTDSTFPYNIDGSGSYLTNDTYYITTGSHIINLFNGYCTQSINFNIGIYDQINFNTTTSSISCFSGSNGEIQVINITGGLPPYEIFYNTLSAPPTSSSGIITNLNSNNYYITIKDSLNCEYEQIINLTQPTKVTSSISVEYDSPCYTRLSITGSGGIPPYTYVVSTPFGVYQQDYGEFNLSIEKLNGYTASIVTVDNNSCAFNTSLEVYSRQYMYSGSYCENI